MTDQKHREWRPSDHLFAARMKIAKAEKKKEHAAPDAQQLVDDAASGMTHAELAAKHGIPVASVPSRLRRLEKGGHKPTVNQNEGSP